LFVHKQKIGYNIININKEVGMTMPVRILIVDDDAAARRRIREALVDGHYLLEEASDGLDGIHKVMAFRPDLILLDVVMPKMDGLKMCKFLHENLETSEIPVIMLTAHGDSAASLKKLELGVNDFITKPFEDDDLIVRVKRQVEIKEKLDRLLSEKEDLHVIQKMIHTLYEKKSMYDLLYTLVRQITGMIEAERCSFVRVREDRQTGVVEASSDSPDVQNLEIDLKKYPEILEVVDSKKILVIQDIGSAPIMAPVRERLEKIRFQSLVLIPVVLGDRIVGTLLLRSARSSKTFTERELRFLEAIAEAARPAILNARLFEKMEEKLLNAPVKDRILEDGKLQYNLPVQENGNRIMDQIFQLKDEIRRLKQVQQEIREQK